MVFFEDVKIQIPQVLIFSDVDPQNVTTSWFGAFVQSKRHRNVVKTSSKSCEAKPPVKLLTDARMKDDLRRSHHQHRPTKRKGRVHSTISTSFMTTTDAVVAATSDHFVSLQIASTVLL